MWTFDAGEDLLEKVLTCKLAATIHTQFHMHDKLDEGNNVSLERFWLLNLSTTQQRHTK